jgi:hypothetical protein
VWEEVALGVTKHLQDIRTALFRDITQRQVVMIQSLEDGTIRCPERSVKDYHSTLRNIPEDR